MKPDDNLERLAKCIQLGLTEPTIMIGSGASIPYGLPSMNELASEITSQLDAKYRHDDTWINFTTELCNTNNLEVALDKITLNDEIHNSILTTVWSFIEKKDREAFKTFLQEDSFPALTSIIKKFIQRAGATNIITTNYDRLIEYAVDFAEGHLETGFSGNCYKNFRCFNASTAKRTINLFKVHGSIDWFKHKTSHKIMATNYIERDFLIDQYVPMIVTPGNGKYRETHNDPFRSVISEADKTLRNSPSYLCIGYGFNDEHIQPIIIDETRNRKKPLVILTKGVTPKMNELFLQDNNSNCLIISEQIGGGTTVFYNKSESVSFPENYWCLEQFYKLWLE